MRYAITAAGGCGSAPSSSAAECESLYEIPAILRAGAENLHDKQPA